MKAEDSGDETFIHTALCAQALWLVTGDKDLLELPRIPGLRIISPASVLRLSEFFWRIDDKGEMESES